MVHSPLTSIRTIVNHFATLADSYMKDEDKVRSIRLNVNFIEQYPDLFTFIMKGPRDVFFGRDVRSITRVLDTEYDLSQVDDLTQDEIKNFNPKRAFDELAAIWRLEISKGNTILPYVPIEATVYVDVDTFSTKMRFKSRFGIIERERT